MVYDHAMELLEVIEKYMETKHKTTDKYVGMAGILAGLLSMFPDTEENREFVQRAKDRYRKETE
jgi:hypothetical protein